MPKLVLTLEIPIDTKELRKSKITPEQFVPENFVICAEDDPRFDQIGIIRDLMTSEEEVEGNTLFYLLRSDQAKLVNVNIKGSLA